MALSRQRAHERRVHALELENQDLRRDVDKLEDALAVHTTAKQAEELSLKGVLRNEIGGSIWQHGGEGKLTSYKSAKDLKNKYGLAADESKNSKRKASEDLSKPGKTTRTTELGKKSLESKSGYTVRKSVNVPGSGSNIGTKSHGLKSASMERMQHKVDTAGQGLDKPGRTYKVTDVGGGKGKVPQMNKTYKVHKPENGETVDNVGGVLSIKSVRGQDSEVEGERMCKDESRIEVLNTMIDKLRESWQLEGEDRGEEGSKLYADDTFVIEWLSSINLKNTERYVEIFGEHEINRQRLKLLDQDKLQHMGISAPTALSKILKGIEELNRKGGKSVNKWTLDKNCEKHKPSQHATKSEVSKSKKVIGGNKDTVVNSDRASPVQIKSVITTKSGRNTFSPKALLTTLESISNVETNKSDESSRNGRVSKVTGDTVSSLAKQKSLESVRSSPGLSSNRPGTASSSRGSVGALAGNSGRFQKQEMDRKSKSGRPLSAVSKKGIHKKSKGVVKKDETDVFESCLDGIVGIRTAVQDVSVAETEESLHTDGDESSSATDPLQTIEDQIVSLSCHQKQPEALEKINFLQERLEKIRAEIERGGAGGGGEAEERQILDKNEDDLFLDKVLEKPRNIDVPPVRKSRNYRTNDKGAKSKPSVQEKEPIAQAIKEADTEQNSEQHVASRNMSKTDLLKHVRKQKDQHRKQIRHLESELSRLKHKDPLRSCEICLTDLHYTTDDLIGEGGFSRVFHGSYQGSDVAVKRLKVPLSAQDKNYFMAEVNLLKDLRHPRVVLLVGVCTTCPLPLMVLEFMARGSLFHYLHNPDCPPLDHLAYYQVAKDTALGMNYLHLHKPAVLHLDLKSMNVLLTQQLRAKIADFGFSKLRHDADVKAKQVRGRATGHSHPSAARGSVKGTPAWLAPEMLDFREVTAKADVYSFGVILWEMLTRRRPYAGFSVFQVIEAVRTNKRPPVPEDCPDQLSQLITSCWDKNPAKRPQFKDILVTLDVLHLPTEWKQLFEEAGVAMETLNDINTTRSLVDLVSTTMTQLDRPHDVPVLDLYDSDTEQRGHMIMQGYSSDEDSEFELPQSEREAAYLELPTKPSKNVKNTEQTFTPKSLNGGIEFSKSSRGGVRSCTPKQEDGKSHDLKEEVAFYDHLAEALLSWQDSEVGESIQKEDSDKQPTGRADGSVDGSSESPQEEWQDRSGASESEVSVDGGATTPKEDGIVGKNSAEEQEMHSGNDEIDVNHSEKLLSTKTNSSANKGLPSKSDNKSRPKSATPSFSRPQQRLNRPSTSQGREIKTSQPQAASKMRPPPVSSVNIPHKTLPKAPMIQPSLAAELRASRLAAQRSNLKVTADVTAENGEKEGVARPASENRSSIRASMLVEQRGRLRGTEVPHPRQLPDLGRVGQSQMSDLANILKKAVSERRVVMVDTHTLESLGSGAWSVED